MSNIDSTVFKQDIAPLLQSLIEGKELEKWQKLFCSVTNVFICCMNGNGLQITDFSGKADEIEKINKILDFDQIQGMITRISESTLEDQAIESTAFPNLRLAIISFKISGKSVLNWLVCGVISDAEDIDDYSNAPLEGFECTINERQFSKVVDALRDTTGALLNYKLTVLDAQA